MRALLPALLFFLGCSSATTTAVENTPFAYESKTMTIRTVTGTVSIEVQIADTDDKRRYGLMNRKTLPENSGMLFVFDDEAPRSFWMKDTPLSLDLIFIAKDGEIAYIVRGATPLSTAPINPQMPAKSVLEVNSGWSERHRVNVGDRARF